MAGLAPFFITGANAKIRLNNRTLAFCQDFSYSVAIKHAAPKVLGQYESNTLEPLSYEVTGSFSVIRYAKGVAGALQNAGMGIPDKIDGGGNGIGQWSGSDKILFDSDGRANDNLDPASFNLATFFDIEVYQKTGAGENIGVARIRSCRIEKADFSIPNKKAPAVERFTFRALFVDEDSFTAGFSGVGQQFT